MPHQDYANPAAPNHPGPVFSCAACSPLLKRLRTLTINFGGLYLLVSVLACAFADPFMKYSKLLGAFLVGGVAIAPAVFFAIEYWWHEHRILPTATGQMMDPEDKAFLDQTKTYQDNLSKIRVAVAAGVFFFYFGELAKKESPSYSCQPAAGGSFTCKPQ
jgi:hypothetical protein